MCGAGVQRMAAGSNSQTIRAHIRNPGMSGRAAEYAGTACGCTITLVTTYFSIPFGAAPSHIARRALEMPAGDAIWLGGQEK